MKITIYRGGTIMKSNSQWSIFRFIFLCICISFAFYAIDGIDTILGKQQVQINFLEIKIKDIHKQIYSLEQSMIEESEIIVDV